MIFLKGRAISNAARNGFSTPVIIILAALISSCGSNRSPGNDRLSASKPNIIFILADDLGYGDVGFNGQEKIQTPHLDKMASEGIIFRQHYAGSTVCGLRGRS
jgi:hypothetical protein